MATRQTRDFVTYEERLTADWEFAVAEGSRFFKGEGEVNETLRKIAERLDALDIPYAVVGGLALYKYGYHRFTEDVDLLVTREGKERTHAALKGRGYRPVSTHPEAKNLRDTERNVKIEFLITGGFPGDGKPKPVAYPDPAECSVVLDGIRYVKLETLVELKLASGMSKEDRAKDLADVGELISAIRLPLAFGEQLHESVRPEFERIWHTRVKRYVTIWRNKWLTAEATSLQGMIDLLAAGADQLREMLADGVELDPASGVGDDYAELFTTDPAIADKYGMVSEEELLRDAPPSEP